MRQQAQQPPAPAAIHLAEPPVELPQSLASLRIGFGSGQIGHRLGLRQVELAVKKGAAGEFARLRQPQPLPAQHRHHGTEHSAAAMQMQFGDIFAGNAARRRQPQHQPVIEVVAGFRVSQPRVPRDTRRRQRPGDRGEAGPALGPEMRMIAMAARPAAVAGA